MSPVILVYTTWPDDASAEAAGRACVEEGLAACANVLAPMRSVYRWQCRVETAAETPMLLKSTAECAAALAERIAALHPYDTPAILTLPISEEGSHPPFLRWVGDSVSAFHSPKESGREAP